MSTPPSTDWWRGATLYQIDPRSFADANGEGLGDLAGITRRLPCVASLGVDGLWISPFFTSPMRDFGYDVADHRGVDPRFGTLADVDALVAEAHQRGRGLLPRTRLTDRPSTPPTPSSRSSCFEPTPA